MSFDLAAIRAQFPILSRRIGNAPLHYLDNAATAQVPEFVLDAVHRFETTSRANVLRGVHRLAEEATAAYAAARHTVAHYLNVPAAEIVFTGGTTGAINLVARSYGELLAPGDEIVISELEHHSNIVPWQLLRDRRGVVLKVLPVRDDGSLNLDGLEEIVTAKCRLIAVTHASNVTGGVTDLGSIRAAAKAVGARILLDGAQRAPHGPIDVPALGVDFYAFSGHKAFAPHGIGALWARRALLEEMPPFMGGGEMIRTVTMERTAYAPPPHKFEAGTPPVAQAIGLGAALDWLMKLDWPAISGHEMRLTQRVLDGLPSRVRVIGPTGLQQRMPVISFDVAGIHPHDICQLLDADGVAMRGGHHCAQPLMDRLGLAGTVRASFALYNSEEDVQALLGGLDRAIHRLARS
ncbi:MAG TPA: SufS family cysteine desulfurase [Alphaproteobacteria bacterium]|nr:SufS family cysteine desulfurase [Alphaproteobacteria bacterium]